MQLMKKALELEPKTCPKGMMDGKVIGTEGNQKFE